MFRTNRSEISRPVTSACDSSATTAPLGPGDNKQPATHGREIARWPAATATATRCNGTGGREQQTRHKEAGHKSLLQSDVLYQYILETSLSPREPECMRELREITAKHPWNLMTTSPDEGQFLGMLLKLIGARRTMEIGVYTGYSLLATALAIPHDGKILAMDIDRETYVDLLLQDEKNLVSFDFVFVDADKDNYLSYHERLMKLVRLGGLVGYDNTLRNGSVVLPDDAPMRKYIRHYRDFVLQLNVALTDDRVEICQLPSATASRSAAA